LKKKEKEKGSQKKKSWKKQKRRRTHSSVFEHWVVLSELQLLYDFDKCRKTTNGSVLMIHSLFKNLLVGLRRKSKRRSEKVGLEKK
jgi:hypothetical protein